VKPFSTISFKLALSVAILFLLQVFQPTGILIQFATLGQVFFLIGVLADLLIIALIIEALSGRLPRFLIAIPILAIGTYYAYCIAAWREVGDIDEALRKTNSLAIPFDAKHDRILGIVVPAALLLTRYDLDEVFVRGSRTSESPTRLTLAHRVDCPPGAVWYRNVTGPYYVVDDSALKREFCIGRSPNAPIDPQISLTVEASQSYVILAGKRVFAGILDFRRGDQSVGQFLQVSTARPSLLPFFFIGCGLSDYPTGWMCGAQPLTESIQLDGTHGKFSRASNLATEVDADIIGNVLGLPPRAPSEQQALGWTGAT